MIVKPRIKGFVCITSHPMGCLSSVKEQADLAVSNQVSIVDKPKRVLVIGASTGYGLSSRIASAFSANADTLGVYFERPPKEEKPASAGFYNSMAFNELTKDLSTKHADINGDAFSEECKTAVTEKAKEFGGAFDLVIYSLASPRRTDPKDGKTYRACLKPIGAVYKNKTLDTDKGEIKEVVLEPATPDDIESTQKVMGGDDWMLWTELLLKENLLATGCTNIAYSYIGPEVTQPIYRHGTIGMAKEHLEQTGHSINEIMRDNCEGRAFVSVNKAVVTQASSAIPVVPLYVSLLFKIMHQKGTHEGCIEQIIRLFNDRLYHEKGVVDVDESGRIRLDDWEMDPIVQSEIIDSWGEITSDNLRERTNFDEYQKEFLKLFGFGIDGVDYEKEVDLISPFTAL
ncbi:trans-2-enoyl-CoA reductase family protein [Opitutales bacterium]|nr:trans-2-enoyl-CoA reductase family protein [Opitutales bacterium]